MSKVFRATTQIRPSILQSPRLLLAIFSALLITAIACGTDRAEDDNGVAASSFQVDGDTLTWAPPWEEGDTRTVSITSSVELSAAAQSFLDRVEESGGEVPEIALDQSSTVGTISIASKDSSGSTGVFDLAVEELVAQMQEQTFEQPGFGEADLSQLTSFIGLADQLDLAVEFGIDGNGSVTGVTNLAELAETVNEFIDPLLRFAALAQDDSIPMDDIEQLRTLLEELPETEAAQLAADSALNAATANLFLMRAGEYTTGQPVVVSGMTPTIIGFATEGTLSYELTEISNGAATVEVLVSPGGVDLVALIQRVTTELTELLGDEADDAIDEITNMGPDERSQIELVAGMVFEPYTVTLTLDTSTGWVTAADWTIDLSLPEGFEDLIEDDDHDLDGIDLEELGATVSVSATFE